MATIYNLHRKKHEAPLQHNRFDAVPVPALDEIIDDEFVARRAIRAGMFDDGLTIPFEAFNPFGQRAASPPPRMARSGGSAVVRLRTRRIFRVLISSFPIAAGGVMFAVLVAAPFLLIWFWGK